MSWSKGKGGGSGDPWRMQDLGSVNKKRKLDQVDEEQTKKTETSKDEWDDDMEFTQEELETLDIMESKALTQSQVSVSVKKITSVKAQSSVSNFAVPKVPSHGRSTSSSSSIPQSSHSRSASTTSTSSSLSSHSSSNGTQDTSKLLQTLQSNLDQEIKNAQEAEYRFNGEVKYLRETLHKQELELEKLRAQREEILDQQKQAQSDKVHLLESQVDSLTYQNQFKDREIQEIRNKFVIMQQKLRRLELQQQKSHQMPAGSQIFTHQSQSPEKTSPKKVPVRPSPPSKQQQKLLEEVPLSQRQSFPTRQTFMEKPVVQTPPRPSASSGVGDQTSTGQERVTNLTLTAKKSAPQRRLALNVRTKNVMGNLKGCHIVQHLLQMCRGSGGSNEGPEDNLCCHGLTSLLNAASTSLILTNLSYLRDKESGFLTPAQNKRTGQKTPDVDKSLVQIVSKEHFLMAVEGLSLLLEEESNSEKTNEGTHDGHRFVLDSLVSKIMAVQELTLSPSYQSVQEKSAAQQQPAAPEASSKRTLESSRTVKDPGLSYETWAIKQTPVISAVVKLIPLVTDYIQHYARLIQTTMMRGPVQPTQSLNASYVSSSSMETLQSFTSSMESTPKSLSDYLQYEGKAYARSMEMFADSALRIIILLVQLCPEVGQFVVRKSFFRSVASISANTTSSSSTGEMDADPPAKASSSGADGDDEQSSASEIGIIPNGRSPLVSLPRLLSGSSLLHLIIRLAGQDLENAQSSPVIVNRALVTLKHLVQCCTVQQMSKFDVIISQGLLTSCLKQTKHSSIHFSALCLLASLATCEKLLARFCKETDNCPLYLMHRICSSKGKGFSPIEMMAYYHQYIICISSIIADHRSGLKLLLTNKCLCTDELVVAVILALREVLIYYKSVHNRGDPSRHLLNTLAQGATLLHTLAQGDIMFVQHHSPAQPLYVRLVSELGNILKENRQDYEYQLSALEELFDFDPDLSQEMEDDEDQMEAKT